VAACVGSAALGASWMTALAVLARGQHPQLFVVGDDAWQVVLIEHRDHRIVILNGEFEQSPETEIDRVCSVLRQRIDVVAGAGLALSLLSNDFRHRRSVGSVIQLDGSPGQVSSTNFVPMTEPIAISVGDIDVQARPLPATQWDQDTNGGVSWIAHVQVGQVVVAMAPSLDLIAQHASIETTLAIAPAGDLGSMKRSLPDVAVAINARSANRPADSQSRIDTDPQGLLLVRIFPQDIAGFVFRDGRLILPDWTQPARGAPPTYSSS